MNGETAEKVVLVILGVIGLCQMFAHPRKSYRLIVHREGWYG